MKATYIIATLFAAIAAASPIETDSAAIENVEVEARQARVIRVQLSDDTTDTAVQANIPANGSRVRISANFANLGNPIRANRALVISGSGTCNIFSDLGAQRRVATIKSSSDDTRFGSTNLQNGVIVCQ